jgi:hypothetical protein
MRKITLIDRNIFHRNMLRDLNDQEHGPKGWNW